MGYEPIHHRYRPQRFDQLVGQAPIARTFTNALQQQRIAPAYLLTGPRGTGKTSSARILARSLNCLATAQPTPEPCGTCELCTAITAGNALDVIEIDAASNTGVDNIRELIERARFAPVQARWKVYVVDECHMLSTAAFNALLKTLEEPPPQVVFVLATTDPQRVLPTIVSRCQRFDFRRIPLADMVQHLSWIASQEAINITPEAVRLVAQLAQGGLRDAESLLDQLGLLPPPVAPEAVWDLMGAVPEQGLLQLGSALAEDQPLNLLQVVRQLFDQGREPAAILQGLTALLRDLLLAAVAPQHQELSTVSPAGWEQATVLANRLGRQRLIALLDALRGSEGQLRHSSQPRLSLEVLLVGLLNVLQTPATPVPAPAAAAAATTATTAAAVAATPVRPVRAPTGMAPPAPAAVSVASVSAAAPPAVQVPAPAATPAAPAAAPAPPSPAAIAAPGVAAGDDGQAERLRQVWQAFLARLELPSTRMLLNQQGRLLHWEGSQLTVEVSADWLAQVQIRLPLLNKAASEALGVEQADIRLTPQPKRSGPSYRKGAPRVPPGQPRQQPVPPPSPSPTPASSPAPPPAAAPRTPAPPATPLSSATPSAAPAASGSPTSAAAAPAPRAATAAVSAPTAAQAPPSAAPTKGQQPSARSPQRSPQPASGSGANNIDAAAFKVADFFNGAVVEAAFDQQDQGGEPET